MKLTVYEPRYAPRSNPGRHTPMAGALLGRRTVRALFAALGISLCLAGLFPSLIAAEARVFLTEVPDYEWDDACFATASGNLMGFWDRHGLANLYTGPTANGVAPMNSYGSNSGIRSLWISRAGRDGRPASLPGHWDDYYVAYDTAADDPFRAAGRIEHTPDCIGDFMGLNQKKWVNMDGECDGNIDGYVYNYWDKTGNRRVNYQPTPAAGKPGADLQSGLRLFAKYRGYEADTFSQLGDLNQEITGPGKGFGYADLRAEIDAGYPVLIFLQNPSEKSRPVGSMPKANPEIHGMLAYGYYVGLDGTEYVMVRTSWATGDGLYRWNEKNWVPWAPVTLTIRGLIGFHPKPRITGFTRDGGQVTVRFEGPDAEVYDVLQGTTRRAQSYVLEAADTLAPGAFRAVSDPTTDREITVTASQNASLFYRLQLIPTPQ